MGEITLKHSDKDLKFIKVMKDWDKNKNKSLDPLLVKKGSKIQVWWICKNSHSIKTAVTNRYRSGGCTKCNRKTHGESVRRAIVAKSGSLIETNPEILKDWDYVKNKKVDPKYFSRGSNKIVHWKCSVCGFQYSTSIRNKVKMKFNCSKCYEDNRNELHRISKLKTTLSEGCPTVATQWHTKKNKNLNFTPSSVSWKSGKVVWWICEKGHEWKTSISNRVESESGCPECKNYGTSRTEIRLLSEVRCLFDNILWRHKLDKDEIDIFLADYGIGIEVDGGYWHKSRKKKDIEKEKRLKEKGVLLIRLRDKKLKKLGDNNILYKASKVTKSEINRVVEKIFDVANLKHSKAYKEYITNKNFQGEEEYQYITSYLPNPTPENSLELKYPQKAKEWSKKNLPLIPSMFTEASDAKVWWTCF